MKDKITLPGLTVTILATLFFIWAIYQLFNIADYPKEITDDDIINNEIEAFNNLKTIILAQNGFFSQDLDENGIKDYAKFIPHLWLAIVKDNRKKNLNLISEEIAFSKSSQKGYNGYVFTSLHNMKVKPDELREINYEKEWAVIAYPKNINVTGRLFFITNNDNEIFAKKNVYNTKSYPADPKKEGWIKIMTEDQIIKEVLD